MLSLPELLIHKASAHTEIAVGISTAGMGSLAHLLQAMNFTASFIAATCGAIIGLHGVARLIYYHWNRRKKHERRHRKSHR